MFLERASYHYDKDRDRYILDQDLHFISNRIKAPFIIPKGFDSDGASVPFGFRNTFPRQQKATYPAFLHDFLYRYKGKYSDLELTKKQCDLVFMDALKSEGMNLIKRKSMYRALRIAIWNRF